MTSHILRKLVGQRQISLHLLVRYGEEVQTNPEAVLGELMHRLYLEVYGEKLTDEDLLQVCERIVNHGNKVTETQTTPADPLETIRNQRKTGERHFSGYYNELVKGWDLSQTLLWLSDFDPDKSRQLYLHEDYELVECMIDTKTKLSQELNRIQYEAALFGFGGKYATGGGNRPNRDEGEVRVHDTTGMTSQAMAAKILALQRRN